MTTYKIELSPDHERALDHMRKDNGANLTREQWVQFMSVRALENHALTMKDEVVEKLASLSDEQFAEASKKRDELIKQRAEEEAQRERDKADALAKQKALDEERAAAQQPAVADAAGVKANG